MQTLPLCTTTEGTCCGTERVWLVRLLNARLKENHNKHEWKSWKDVLQSENFAVFYLERLKKGWRFGVGSKWSTIILIEQLTIKQ